MLYEVITQSGDMYTFSEKARRATCGTVLTSFLRRSLTSPGRVEFGRWRIGDRSYELPPAGGKLRP